MHRESWLCGPCRTAVAVLVFAIALASSWHSAQAETLDVDGVVREALLRNHDLKAARAQIDAALGRLKQAGLWPNPRLELSNETDRPFANEGEYSRSVGLSQDFPISGRLALASNVARVDVARALAEVNEAERKLAGDVATAFFEIAVIDRKVALRDRIIGAVKTLAAATKDRYRAGEVSELDVNAAALELQRLTQERATLLGERAAAIRMLAGLAGFGSNEVLQLDTKMPRDTPVGPAAQLIGQAMDKRPDLRLLALAADRAEADRVLASASAWEDWTVSLGVKQDRLVIDGAPPQPTSDALMVTLAVPVPLFNRNEGTQDAARAEKAAAQEQLLALGQRIENEVVGKRDQLAQLAEALRVYQEQTLPLARKNSDLARAAYRAGQVSISEVVQAQRLENETGLNYAETLAQYFNALVQLQMATVAHAALMTHPVETPDQTPGEP